MEGDNDIVVYTAVFDNYDVLIDPPDFDVDFVCFTDESTSIPEGWDVRTLNEDGLSPKLSSGKVKVLPHQQFPEYDISLWIDGNVVLRGPPSGLISEYLKTSNLAVPEQPFRDCIYEEAEEVVRLGKSDPEAARKQMERYRRMDFPENFGLSETRVMLRKHNEDDVINTMECWWDEYVRGAERDQLSFEFAAWRNDLDYTHMPPDITIDSRFFKLYPHRDSIKYDQLYEQCLRERWNPRTSHTFLLAYIILKIQVGLYNIKSSIDILKKDGVSKVVKMFRRHYW